MRATNSSSSATDRRRRDGYKEPRWPVEGTKAEKRAERDGRLSGSAGRLFGAGAPAGLPVLAVGVQAVRLEGEFLYIAGHPALRADVRPVDPGDRHRRGAVPEEVHPRRDFDPGPPRRALPRDPAQDHRSQPQRTRSRTSTLKRRKLIGVSLGFGLGAFGLGTLVAFAGGLIKNPWTGGRPPRAPRRSCGRRGGPRASTARPSTCAATPDARRITVRQGAPGGHRRRRHGDGVPVPGVRRRRHHVESEHKLTEIARRPQPGHADPPRPRTCPEVVKRKGQESFNFGDYFAYSKVCTHLGCPTSLYEQQTNRILCPCHQSQFDALQFAKPIFGPAARALPQLPITLTKRATWSPTATSSSPSDRHFGSVAHESETC